MSKVSRWDLLVLYLLIVVAPIVIIPFGIMLYQAWVYTTVLALFLYALSDIGDVKRK